MRLETSQERPRVGDTAGARLGAVTGGSVIRAPLGHVVCSVTSEPDAHLPAAETNGRPRVTTAGRRDPAAPSITQLDIHC